jgi:hypothetical protein
VVREDDLRDVFGALHAGNDPDLGFDVSDVVRAGGRVRRRRRAVAVVGSGLATVAAVVVAIVLLPGERAPAPVEPAGPETSWAPRSTDPASLVSSPVPTPSSETSSPPSSTPREGGTPRSDNHPTNESLPNSS